MCISYLQPKWVLLRGTGKKLYCSRNQDIRFTLAFHYTWKALEGN